MGDITRDYALPSAVRQDWTDYRFFLAVVELGSISAGARALSLSQPAMSKRISTLESRLGAQLFVRRANGVALTSAGQRLYAHVRTMGRAAAAIHELIAETDGRDEGRVRIAAPDGVAALWLAPRLADFYRINPNITLSIDSGLWPNEPMREDIDLSLQYDVGGAPDHVVIELATKHYAPFAARAYLDLYGEPSSIEDMASHRVIHHTAQTRQAETWRSSVHDLRARWRADIETNSSSAVVSAVRAGAGIAFLPTTIWTVAPELVMLGDGPLASIKLWLVYRRELARVRRARCVIEWLKAIHDPKRNPWHRAEFIHPRDFAGLAREFLTEHAIIEA